MYISHHFAENDAQILRDFMRDYSFATLVTQHDGAPFANHVPLTFDPDIGTHGALFGHLAKPNPQWRDMAAGAEVLVIFQGAHAYVSPSWYEQNPLAAPTWNYLAVHADGKARILSETELIGVLEKLTHDHEQFQPQPWQFELNDMMRKKMLSVIVGFEITLTRVEGKFKLSQNRSEQDQRNVLEKLAQSEHGKDVAQAMRKNLQRK
jgi:transcriptional regulator